MKKRKEKKQPVPKKYFFDHFGGRKNFAFFIIAFIGAILAWTGRLSAEIYFGFLTASYAALGHFNIEAKRADQPVLRVDKEEQPNEIGFAKDAIGIESYSEEDEPASGMEV